MSKKPRMPPHSSPAFMAMLEIERPGFQDRIWKTADTVARQLCEQDAVIGLKSYDAYYRYGIWWRLKNLSEARRRQRGKTSEVPAR